MNCWVIKFTLGQLYEFKINHLICSCSICMYSCLLWLLWKQVATVSGMVKFTPKLDLLFFFINWVGGLLSLDRHNILEYSQTLMDRTQFNPSMHSNDTSIDNSLLSPCAVNVFTSMVYRFYLGAQWLSGRVLDLRPRGRGFSLTGVTALWSLGKTHLS